MSIFKACDVRGRYGTELTDAAAYGLGQAIGSAMWEAVPTPTTGAQERPTLVVGGDVRLSTPPLKAALVAGLTATGCRVLDVGILPTPAFYFAKDHLHAVGGVMVTGSHNPAADNGFKISLGPRPITEDDLAHLAARMAANDFVARAGGGVEQVDVLADYSRYIKGKAGPAPAPFKVVVDAGNGCYSHIAPAVLAELGFEVVPLFCEPDGRFPNRAPNPAVAANLTALRQAVREQGAGLGVAYDGDGDRAVFVDECGRVVENDKSIVLLARHLLGINKPPTPFTNEVIYDIKCSSIVPEQVAAAGGQPIMEKSGHVFIKTALLAHRAVFGGEISGHFFFGELGGDDGLYATLMMLRIVAESGGGLAALAGALPRYPITPDLRLPCPPDVAQAIVRRLTAEFADEPGCAVSLLDGIRLAWADGWALVRPSVTEPLMTLRFEAHTEARLSEIRRRLAASLPELTGVA
jgi:phosphomannomutase / phosphoglucomutase